MKKTKFNKFIENLEKVKLHTRIIVTALVLAVICFIAYMLYYINSNIVIGEINNGRFLEVIANDVIISASVFALEFIVSYLYIYINNKIAIKIIKKLGNKEGKTVKKIPNKSIAFLFSIVAAFVAVEILSSNLMEFLNTTSFMQKDPIFNKDISYYIMQRPFISVFIKFVSGYLIAVLLYLLGYYTACFGYYFDGVEKKNIKASHWLRHLIVTGCIYLAVNIFDTFFYKESILFTKLNRTNSNLFSKLVGSGFTDVTIKLVYFKILPFMLILFVIWGILLFKKKKYKKMIWIPATYLIVTIFQYLIVGTVQAIYVKPNEIMVEKKYVQYHLDYTKKAYGIDLRKNDIALNKQFTENDLNVYKNIIDNVNVLEKNNYLEFLNKDKDSYTTYDKLSEIVKEVNGKNTLIYIAQQEMASEKLNKAEYINKNIKYVYGNGVKALTLNTDENQIDDVSEEVIKPNQKIYYGTSTKLDAIVNPANIFDSDSTVEKEYSGANGLSMTPLNKVNITLKNLDFNTLLAKYIDKDSKYLITRNIVDRVSTIFSSLLVDKNPYLVLDSTGKAYYVVDLYTVADNYPYSKSIEIDKTKFEVKKPKVDLSKVNYIRNSIKVIVDPYDGNLYVYNTDETDPIAISYKKRYPSLFNSNNEVLYKDLENTFKYPQSLLDIQVEILKEYYVDYAENFYKNETFLKIPTYLDENNNKVEMQSTYLYTKLEDEQEGLVLIKPIAYSSEDLAGYFTGTVKDGKNKLNLYNVKDNNTKVLSMAQLDEQIQTEYKDFQTELEKIKDNRNNILKKVIILPIDNKIIYLQIYYSVPIDFTGEAKIEKVIVSDGKKIALAETVMNAIKNLYKNSENAISEEVLNDSLSINIEKVLETYKYMKDTLKQGDFEMFGRELENLDEEMLKLEEKYNDEKKSKEKEEQKTNDDKSEETTTE